MKRSPGDVPPYVAGRFNAPNNWFHGPFLRVLAWPDRKPLPIDKFMATSHPHSSDDQSAEAIERLMDQYTQIARLAGALAHEIKNPLSTIRLNMELLLEDLDEAEGPVQRRAVKQVELVHRECQRLQDLLDDFLNYAKVRQLDLTPTDLNTQIDELLEFFSPETRSAEIEVLRYFDPELPHVNLDREAFRGAFLNLLINARQAMPRGGQLTVRTHGKGDNVAVQVIDTGHGVDEKTASRMFEAFFSTKPSGSGLGLPTTSKIIEAHGGRISVQSEVGHGTQFTIELPVSPRLPDNPVSSS